MSLADDTDNQCTDDPAWIQKDADMSAEGPALIGTGRIEVATMLAANLTRIESHTSIPL